MRIVFINAEIQVEANNFSKLITKYGEIKARKIKQRLDEMCAASNLEDLNKLPAARCTCTDYERQIVTVCTIPPDVITFGIIKNFEDKNEYLWEKVLFVEIISLDGV